MYCRLNRAWYYIGGIVCFSICASEPFRSNADPQRVVRFRASALQELKRRLDGAINAEKTKALADTVLELQNNGATFLENTGAFKNSDTYFNSHDRKAILSNITLSELPMPWYEMLRRYFAEAKVRGCSIVTCAAVSVICGVAGLAGTGFAIIDCVSGGSAFANDGGGCDDYHIGTLAMSLSALGGAGIYGACARNAYNDNVYCTRALKTLDQSILRNVVVSHDNGDTEATPFVSVNR